MWQRNSSNSGFEAVVSRLVTDELAYVYRMDRPEDGEGRRYALRRTLVTRPDGTFSPVEEGTVLRVDVDPEDPDRITFAEVIHHAHSHVTA